MRKLIDDPSIFPVKRWRPVHVIVWEAAHGTVPDGHIVILRPGMKTFVAADITADRLEVAIMAENMRRNTFHNRYTPEVKELIHLRRALPAESTNARRSRSMKNKVRDVRDHLVAMLERLGDDNLSAEDMGLVIERAKTSTMVATTYIGAVKVERMQDLAPVWGCTKHNVYDLFYEDRALPPQPHRTRRRLPRPRRFRH